MMNKFTAAILTALTLLTFAAAAEASCENGLCKLPEEPAAAGGVVCENGVCRLPETPAPAAPEAELQLTVLRRVQGYQDADALRHFLQGKPPAGSNFLRNAGRLWLLPLVLLAGLLLNFTPCVLPLIPVHLAMITAGDPKRPRRQALCYGAGMAAGCTMTGLLFIAAGLPLGALNASPWFNLITGALLLALTPAVLGLWRLDFSGWRRGIFAWNTAGALLTGVTGALMAVLSGACAAPVLLAALLLAADLVRQGERIAWLIPPLLGIGMGSFWPLAAGHAVKISGRLGRPVKILLALLTAAAGIYSLALGIRLLRPAGETAPEPELKTAAAAALAAGKPLLVRVGAPWCRECRRLETGPWRDEEVQKLIQENFITAVISADDPAYAGLLRQWEVNGVPAILIVRCEPPETE